jgi:hypothetical protein
MRTLPDACRTQIAAAYRRMALEARYRPAAPSDGFGHITVPLRDLDLDAEAEAYAEHWWTEEDGLSFWIGCANFPTRPAMIFAVEAARLLAAGTVGTPYARRLLRLALKTLERGDDEP